MSKYRKDEHINIAKMAKQQSNMFDSIILEGTDLPNMGIEDVDLSTTFLGMDVPYPIYINAMTGGSQKAYEINEFLAKIANHFNLPMVTGSQSIMFKDLTSKSSFEVIRKHHKGIVVSNINPNMTLNQALEAIKLLDSNALSIHLNVIQELVMKEGDRNFSLWSTQIKEIVDEVKVPVLVKQVGLGMSLKTVKALKNLGVKYIDVSGSGGTSFIDIESQRSQKDYSYLKDFTIDTARALIDLNEVINLEIYASGGIRNPLDVVKSLILGAKAVGLSKWFLDLTQNSFDEAIIKVNDFLLDIKKVMIILGASNIKSLQHLPYKIK